MFNALMMSYTRIPYALAHEGLLPRVFTRRTPTGVPWASVLVLACAGASPSASPSSGSSQSISSSTAPPSSSSSSPSSSSASASPSSAAPSRVPGGLPGAILAGIGPTCLIAFALYAARTERMAGMPALAFAALLAALGPLLYLTARQSKSRPYPERPACITVLNCL